jgi:uncharacterized membrane protein YsdA (DUF1294 family)
LENIFTLVFIIVNVIGFLVMGLDKRRAVKQMWRIPEKTLWLIAFFMGAVGTTFGMYMFRHKTKHISFKFGLPLLAVLQVLFFFYYMNDDWTTIILQFY